VANSVGEPAEAGRPDWELGELGGSWVIREIEEIRELIGYWG
jgi:hypothetical protein